MRTKNELSFQKASLDYEAMIQGARIAVNKTQGSVENYNNRLHNALSEGDTTLLRLLPNWMEEEIKKLAVCTETLASLIGGIDRAHVVIVNRTMTKEARVYLDSEKESDDSNEA